MGEMDPSLVDVSPVLSCAGLRAELPGDDGPLRVLDGIDLELSPRSLTDVVGASGSGKTTLLRALARLLPGASGELRLHSRPARDWEPQKWRAHVALLPQRESLIAGSVADNLTLPWRLKVRSAEVQPGPDALRAALDGVNLGDVALDRDASRLSVGQASRIALLRVVLTGPDVLLLDEPDSSLDDESAEQVARMTDAFIADGGAVVRVRHLRTDARADRRFRLESGRLEELVAS
jgi:putative ABC transport system ATP-binding protein